MLKAFPLLVYVMLNLGNRVSKMEGFTQLPSATYYSTTINASTRINTLEHFWESTGFCPPDPHQDFYKFMSTNDIAQNLAYIGSVPSQGIRQVRIHWLLDLMTMHEGSNGKPVYLFTYLDKALDLLLIHGLKPGFELMGNPSNYFTDFGDDKQIYMWRDVVHSLAVHLIDQYGIEEVSQWNFESWNEPQNIHHFDGLHVTLQGYLNYYDACSEGLHMAHPSLRLGGPATGNPESHPIFWALIKHCYDGKNFFTGEQGVRLDFISFHIKGEGCSMTIIETEEQVLTKIRQTYPRFVGVPVYNDEADPLVGWSQGKEWRADARYAAVVIKIIAQHQNILFKQNQKVRYSLLSNDNGFMNYPPSYFSQRTLLARFQMNTSHPRKVEFIKKPVLSVMGLLALLGDRQVYGQVTPKGDSKASNDSDFGAIATTFTSSYADMSPDNWQLAAIFYNSNDTTNKTGLAVLDVTIVGVPVIKEPLYVLYQVDDEHGNPYGVWVGMKSPVFPTDEQFEQLRSNQEPVRVVGPQPLPSEEYPGQVTFSFHLPLPGVALLHICAKPLMPPTQVEQLSLLSVSNNEVLVSWKHPEARCIKTYAVLYSHQSEAGPYARVNNKDLIFCAFHHVVKATDVTKGRWYKVGAVDYWNRGSPASQTVDWRTGGRKQLPMNLTDVQTLAGVTIQIMCHANSKPL